MKTCPRCREVSEDNFDTCWKCLTQLPDSGVIPEPLPDTPENAPRRKVDFKIFRGTFATWNTLFTEAAEFGSEIGQANLINISHSEDDDHGVVVVWYWTDVY